ncbi:hypothetical protein [Burkholderia glumae]|uniref:hypothetical protein n=1 Tax=Burkholderia glumae TaxID=337 RepID=UPI002151B083|nr:hypothetical protein [Burkholderia glumae]
MSAQTFEMTRQDFYGAVLELHGAQRQTGGLWPIHGRRVADGTGWTRFGAHETGWNRWNLRGAVILIDPGGDTFWQCWPDSNPNRVFGVRDLLRNVGWCRGAR